MLTAGAIVGWGLLESADYERQAEYETAEYARNANEQVGQACFRLPVSEQSQCLHQANEELRAYERNEQDLVAQRKSALWAYIMGAAAVVGMILSAVGVFLVWTTFRETQRTANAALDANEIAKDTAHRQLRAYVNVTQVKMTGFEIGSKPRLELEMFNGGQTPARGCTVQIFYHYCESDPDTVKMPLRGSKRRSLMDILPGKPSFSGLLFDEPIDSNVLTKVLSGQGTIIFAGYIAYRDIFGKRHLTLFRYFVVPQLINDEGTASLVASYRQNRST